MSEPITLTDWRGTPYTVGDSVIYSRMYGRSVEMVEGTVVDISYARWDSINYNGWYRIDPAEAIDRDELRVKVQPSGLGSRDFSRSGITYHRDESGQIQKTVGEIKPVTLTTIQNITAIPVRTA